MSNRVYYPIDEQSARSAHDMMSMRDYTAGSKTAEYKGYADRAYELAERIEQERRAKAGIYLQASPSCRAYVRFRW